MRDRLIELLQENSYLDVLDDEHWALAAEQLLAEGVVLAVRCKDCARYSEIRGFEYKGRKARFCAWHGALRLENDYCSDGIRRTENAE